MVLRLMSTPPEPEQPVSAKDVEVLISHIVSLQARLDALNAMVEVMASHQKMPLSLFRSSMKKIYDTCLQKRLEPIEEIDQAGAAKLDPRGDTPDIDPDLLRDLRQGWKGEE